MLTMAIPETGKFWRFACLQYVLMHSLDGTNNYGSKGGV